jgi:hypothetical protein
MDLCKSGIHARMLFGYASEPPSREDISRNVESALTIFLKAYGAPGYEWRKAPVS